MAEMRLTEPDSSGDAGIDIVASPPGKRLQNVLLLSGGEKAMTALALLIAIFRYQPSPFCIPMKWTPRSTKPTLAASRASSAT
jgi:chromosome segregation protein